MFGVYNIYNNTDQEFWDWEIVVPLPRCIVLNLGRTVYLTFWCLNWSENFDFWNVNNAVFYFLLILEILMTEVIFNKIFPEKNKNK